EIHIYNVRVDCGEQLLWTEHLKQRGVIRVDVAKPYWPIGGIRADRNSLPRRGKHRTTRRIYIEEVIRKQIWGGKLSRYGIPIYFSPARTERTRDIADAAVAGAQARF